MAFRDDNNPFWGLDLILGHGLSRLDILLPLCVEIIIKDETVQTQISCLTVSALFTHPFLS